MLEALKPGPNRITLDGRDRAVEQSIERWKPIVETNGLYEVSDRGRIWSKPRPSSAGGIKKLSTLSSGHLSVSFCVSGRQWSRLVHRLVAEAFLGPSPEGREVCHADGDPTNNDARNLRYDTRSANVLDQVIHGVHNNASKTHCQNGHEFTAENTLRRSGGARRCRMCNIAAQAKYNARRKQRD